MALPTHSATTPSFSVTQEGSSFGSTEVSGGLLLQGNFAGITINPPASARTDYVGHYSHSSLHPVRGYIDRPALCDKISKQLDRASSQDRHEGTRILAVWGLGGAGKTQLVLDYLRRHQNNYKATFWIEAGRKESIERDFVFLYQLLFGVQMTTGQEVIKADDAVMRVKSWLSSRSNDRWLLVLDGADAVDDEKDDEYIDVMHYVPESRLLDVIVTTRSRTAKDMTALDGVEVSEMEEDQAASLFYALSKLKDRGQNTRGEVKLIVKELGYFALAITLAGTYVAETPRLQSDIRQYLPEYHDRRRELLSRKPTKLIHQYGESVLTTWEASFTAIHRKCMEACQLLTILAFINFDDIFPEIFSPGLLEHGGSDATWRSVISPNRLFDEYKAEECFKALQTCSLVQWKEDRGSYSMHKLVHAWANERLDADQQREYSLAGLQLLEEAIAGCKEEPQVKLRLASHIMANFSMISRQGWLADHAKTILDQLARSARFIYSIGRWVEACAIDKYIYKERRNILGEEHLDTIDAMDNLARVLTNLGQLEEAAAMRKEVLEKRKQILGEEHPKTLTAIDNLASTLRRQGQVDKAVAMRKEVLERSRQILGEEHPTTIKTMNNLANALNEQGKLEEAAAMQKEVLEKRKQILGEEHPKTLIAIDNLASTLRRQGQLDKAVAMRKEVLEKMKQILGEEHPTTIKIMNNLANELNIQGKLGGASAMQREVLEKRKQILGENHPSTIRTIGDLANTLYKQGWLEEAVVMQKEVLEKSRWILGEEHPNTIMEADALAGMLSEQGQLDEAAVMQKETIKRIEGSLVKIV